MWFLALLYASPAATQTPSATIHDAAIRGSVEEVESLLRAGADVEARDENGKTALYLAAREGHEAVARLLLEWGADVGATTNDGVTPLHTAANGGHVSVMRLLLDGGADVGAMGPSGFGTPLHQAAMGGTVGAVRLLIEHGADATASDRLGSTPRVRAVSGGHAEAARLILEIEGEVGRANALEREAIAHYRDGRYARATALARQALAIREEVLGEAHPDVATSLNDLAALLHTRGRYDDARPLYERALAIRERTFGPDHADVARSLNNLAVLLAEQGDLETARPLFERTVGIWEAGAAEGLELAVTLNWLGDLLRRQGEHEEARRLLERSLSIREGVQGLEARELLPPLSNLGTLYRAQGEHEAARRLYERALAIAEETLGPSHPGVGLLRHNLGDLHRIQGDLATARPLLEDALAGLEAALGPEHPDLGEPLEALALTLQAQGERERAQALSLRAGRIYGEFADRMLPTLSFGEQRHFVDLELRRVSDLLLSTHPDGEGLSTAYGLLGGWKGLLLRELRRQRGLADLAGDSARAGEVARLRELRSRIARAFRDGDPALEELTAEKEALERDLSAALPVDVFEDPWRVRGREALISELPPGAESLDFYRNVIRETEGLRGVLPPGAAFVDVYRRAPVEEGGYGPLRYSAVVLTREDEPLLVELGEAGPIDRQLETWRSEVIRGVEARSSTEVLARALWDPIANVLPDRIARVWISPAGDLVRAPWGALAGEREVAEGLLVAQVASARALITLLSETPEEDPHPTLLLVGAVAFGETESPFGPLPGTRAEVEVLRRLAAGQGVEPLVLEGEEPTAPVVVRSLADATYAHLATHGFFYGESETVYASRGLEIEEGGGSSPASSGVLHRNPLAESGLALVGANEERTGGMLTAEELVGLDLSGTRLVTLSACETGRGREVTGQGVMGLQASFTAAGARTLLMSLWSVPDASTAALMEAFYRGLWEEGLSPAEALQRAQAEIRSRPGWEAPVHWAAWVLSGDAFAPSGEV